MTAQHFNRKDLLDLAYNLLVKGGLEAGKAAIVADLLVQTDELGVTTHGISMVPYYLPELASGAMRKDGDFDILRDGGATMVWDGNYMPGHWLMTQALNLAMQRATQHGLSAIAIRRSHHIGCLSALTRIAAAKGFVCMIMTSDPSGKWVAPYGGADPVFTPNPWAIGYPGGEHPVLIDTCASITTVSKVREHINSGSRFAHPWMLDGEGKATTDPNVVNATPKGTIQLTGGMDHGHKGFAMALMVEMLTQALAGHGRADHPTQWGANVYLQVIDPAAFGGRGAFVEQVGFLNDACRASRPSEGFGGVRIPGDRAQAALVRAQGSGVAVPDEVWTRVSVSAAQFGVALPEPLAG
ncbi:MAG: Ldh family oxidoreductase [Notoacmeibacter sp.]|nr:Ldh family oxidoreductase [Notoacmeibacter sp.]